MCSTPYNDLYLVTENYCIFPRVCQCYVFSNLFTNHISYYYIDWVPSTYYQIMRRVATRQYVRNNIVYVFSNYQLYTMYM